MATEIKTLVSYKQLQSDHVGISQAWSWDGPPSSLSSGFPLPTGIWMSSYCSSYNRTGLATISTVLQVPAQNSPGCEVIKDSAPIPGNTFRCSVWQTDCFQSITKRWRNCFGTATVIKTLWRTLNFIPQFETWASSFVSLAIAIWKAPQA